MISDAAYTLLFYAISITTIVFALMVTMSRSLLRAAIYLMVVLLTSACLYIMLDAEFLAGIQVLVYVGGIVVLIVFAIMLTMSAELLDRPPLRRKLLAGLASLLFAAATIGIFWTSQFPIAQDNTAVPPNNTQEIGLKLLDYGSSGYILPFEIISILLLAAIIGGIVVARKAPPPEQPFTTGGDLKGEAEFEAPHTQRPKAMTGKHI